MKKLLVFTAIIASSLIATKGYSQVYVGARFHAGFGYPVYRPRFHGPVIYGGAYVAPAPVYAPAPAYAPGYEQAPAYEQPPACEQAPVYAPAPAIDYDQYPGYAYYNYPAWYGHFRDRVYYEHYRPYFMHAHPYYRGWYHGRRW